MTLWNDYIFIHTIDYTNHPNYLDTFVLHQQPIIIIFWDLKFIVREHRDNAMIDKSAHN